MFRHLIVSSLLLFTGICNGQDDSRAISEARSQIEAANVILRAFNPFDVLFTIEESVEAGGVIAPVSSFRWRIRSDEENKEVLLAANEKRLPVELGLAGVLDKWDSRSFVKKLNGGNCTHYRFDGFRNSVRAHKTFEEALIVERIPDVPVLLHTNFLQAAANVKKAQESFVRIFSLADSASTSSVVLDDEPAIAVKVVLDDERMREIHRWIYGTGSEVYLHEITQYPHNYPKLSVLRQELLWEDHPSYGRVPVEVRTVQPVYLTLKPKGESGKEMRLTGKKYVDVSLIWREFNSEADEIALFERQQSTEGLQNLLQPPGPSVVSTREGQP